MTELPAAILCAELARALGVHVRVNEMIRALATAKLTLESTAEVNPAKGQMRVRGSFW